MVHVSLTVQHLSAVSSAETWFARRHDVHELIGFVLGSYTSNYSCACKWVPVSSHGTSSNMVNDSFDVFLLVVQHACIMFLNPLGLNC